MGRRSEQRIIISFPVVVRGTDSRGSPFVVTSKTHDVSCTGASLEGLQGLVEPGAKIEIESQNQKAWYRVQWASAENRTKEWRIGVRCLEPGKYIWGVPPKEWEPDTFDLTTANAPVAASSVAAPAPAVQQQPRERRRFMRHPCRLEVQVATEGAYGPVVVKGKITDISLGGCYVEMLAPLPEETPVELAFSTGDAALHLAAKVCSAQDGFGMGLTFTGMNPEDFEILRRFAPPTKDFRKGASPARYSAPQAGTAPRNATPSTPHIPKSSVAYAAELASNPSTPSQARLELYQGPAAKVFGPADLPDSAIALDALVRLLIRKGIISSAELHEELEQWKAVHT